MTLDQFEETLASLSVEGGFGVARVSISVFLYLLIYNPAFAGSLPDSSSSFPEIAVGLIVFIILASMVAVTKALATSRWSLSDALSEEVDVTALDGDGKPILGPDNKPETVSKLCASSSRIIALFGLIGILSMYLGFGLVAIRNFATDGSLPSSESFGNIRTFLFSGVTMFAPYLVNKFSSVFDWITPKKTQQ